jgi:hypothetical protein
MVKNFKKIITEKLNFFLSKTTIYLSLGLLFAVAKGTSVRFSILITLTAVSVNCVERRSCFATPLGELKFKKSVYHPSTSRPNQPWCDGPFQVPGDTLFQQKKASGSIEVLEP